GHEFLQEKNFGEARNVFKRFLRDYPEHTYAGNSQYWLAEMHYVRGSYATALPQFQRVIDSYPNSDKLADALLKIGYCNYELGNIDAARQSLQQVQRLYPNTAAAGLANDRLALIARETG
ncbi:MAG: tol-pal system protein YbgF, partial [Gammaproteobacteria bacterium]|nr:tol-pal system protein YbgF [Gammaproteobacteria bacterium]